MWQLAHVMDRGFSKLSFERSFATSGPVLLSESAGECQHFGGSGIMGEAQVKLENRALYFP